MLLLLLLPAMGWAQRPVIRPTTPTVPTIGNRTIGAGSTNDSLRRRNYDDSLNLKYYFLDSSRVHRLDSNINDFSKRFPIPADYITLGNTELVEAKRRIKMLADAFRTDGTRITENLDFAAAPATVER